MTPMHATSRQVTDPGFYVFDGYWAPIAGPFNTEQEAGFKSRTLADAEAIEYAEVCPCPDGCHFCQDGIVFGQ